MRRLLAAGSWEFGRGEVTADYIYPHVETDAAEVAPATDARAESAFSRFFRTEAPRLINYLRRFVAPDAAEELAQEAFARVYASQSEVRSPSGLLYQTARNLLIDRKRRERTAGRVLEDGAPTESVPDEHASPEDQVLFRQRLERAARMIERMPPKCRKVFLMQVIDGASYAEISAHMGISVATVKMHLVRAFEICAAHAEAEGIENGRRLKRDAGKKS